MMVLLLSMMVVLSGAAAHDPPRRVVSINLCADQLLVALAEPDRIASLTFMAADRDLSHVAEAASRYPLNHGQIEEIMSVDPDLIVAGQYSAEPALTFFGKRGVPIVMIGIPSDFAGIRADVRAVAAALGDPGRGEAAIAAMDRTLATVQARPARGRVLAWQAGGFSAGTGTLTDSVLHAAGLTNVAADIGLAGYGYLSLEAVIAGNPDILVAESRMPDRPSLREALLHHPALDRLSGIRRVTIPNDLLACGAPFTADAVRLLAQAVAP